MSTIADTPRPTITTSVRRTRLDPKTYAFVEVATYPEAEVRQLGRHGLTGGDIWQLRVLRDDPETGEHLDVDGDVAYGRLMMDTATETYVSGGAWVQVTGFVADDEADYDPSATDRREGRGSSGQWVLERWSQYVPSEADDG